MRQYTSSLFLLLSLLLSTHNYTELLLNSVLSKKNLTVLQFAIQDLTKQKYIMSGGGKKGEVGFSKKKSYILQLFTPRF